LLTLQGGLTLRAPATNVKNSEKILIVIPIQTRNVISNTVIYAL